MLGWVWPPLSPSLKVGRGVGRRVTSWTAVKATSHSMSSAEVCEPSCRCTSWGQGGWGQGGRPCRCEGHACPRAHPLLAPVQPQGV